MGQEEITEELHTFLHAKSKKETSKPMKVIRDKRQFSVRIPMKLARLFNLDSTKDVFQFEATIPKPNEDKPAKLIASLIKKL